MSSTDDGYPTELINALRAKGYTGNPEVDEDDLELPHYATILHCLWEHMDHKTAAVAAVELVEWAFEPGPSGFPGYRFEFFLDRLYNDIEDSYDEWWSARNPS